MFHGFHRKRPRRVGLSSHRFALSTLLAFHSILLLCATAAGTDRLVEYKEKYDRENDPVRKAKVLAKLGDLQVAEVVRLADTNDVDAAFAMLAEYRAEVRGTFDALKATGIDAERKPAGFKELQIHLRKALWQLDRAALLIPGERRPAFQDIRDELNRIHNDLIRRLFPREPGAKRSGEKLEV